MRPRWWNEANGNEKHIIFLYRPRLLKWAIWTMDLLVKYIYDPMYNENIMKNIEYLNEQKHSLLSNDESEADGIYMSITWLELDPFASKTFNKKKKTNPKFSENLIVNKYFFLKRKYMYKVTFSSEIQLSHLNVKILSIKYKVQRTHNSENSQFIFHDPFKIPTRLF
jgi:hypothetical protein